MRWNVEGADASTGRDRLVTVEADDQQQAEVAARMKGLLVSAIHPVRVLTPAEKLDQMMSGKLDASTLTSANINEQMTGAAVDAISNAEPMPPDSARNSPPTVEYRNAPALNVQFAGHTIMPRYVYLRIAGYVLGGVAMIAYLAGAVYFSLAIYRLQFYYLGGVNAVMDAMMMLLNSGMPLLAGALLHATSAGCFALRDIARNAHR